MGGTEDENTMNFDDIGKSFNEPEDLLPLQDDEILKIENFDDFSEQNLTSVNNQNDLPSQKPYGEEINIQDEVVSETDLNSISDNYTVSKPKSNSEATLEFEQVNIDDFTKSEPKGYSHVNMQIPAGGDNNAKQVKQKKSDKGMIILLIVLSVVFVVAFILLLLPKKDSSIDSLNNSSSQSILKEPESMNYGAEQEDFDDMYDTDTMQESDELEPEMVSYSIETTENANPFLPYNDNTYVMQRAIPSNLVAPPEFLSQDSDASHVVSTKVSGIMYDSKSPSAILNIDGQDYLVRSGDIISGYKVLMITPNYVTVQLGKNIYKAGVGENLNDKSDVNYNDVYDLENKFGGANKNKGI